MWCSPAAPKISFAACPISTTSIRRLKAYAAAGADCLYAPGINKREQIEAVVKAVAPKPVNFLNSGAFGFTVSDLAAMGVRRISVGGSLARVAMHAFIRTATEIAKDGKFDGFAGLITNPELNKFFARGSQEAFAMTASEPHPQTGQPIGLPVADPTPAPRPGPVTLKGRYGRLEKLGPEHAADLWEVFAGHDQVWTYISADGPFAVEDEFSPSSPSARRPTDPYAYAIIDPSDRAVGYLTLLRIVPEHRVIEVGHVLYSPALQRTPLGTETQYLLARYVFETLGYRRYEWKCDALNAASRRAALRYGFVYEGTFRQYMINKEGRNRDVAWFSMLDSEWPARKANFERWLDAAEFRRRRPAERSVLRLERRRQAGGPHEQTEFKASRAGDRGRAGHRPRHCRSADRRRRHRHRHRSRRGQAQRPQGGEAAKARRARAGRYRRAGQDRSRANSARSTFWSIAPAMSPTARCSIAPTRTGIFPSTSTSNPCTA